MKRIKRLISLLLCLGILASFSSCVALRTGDNGNHKGWFKNTHNPHHPFSNNPGHAKAKVNMHKKNK